MPEISVRNWKNKELRKLDLAAEVFDYPLKQHLVYEAVCAYQAASDLHDGTISTIDS